MHLQFPTRAIALTLVLASCTTSAPPATPSPTGLPTATTAASARATTTPAALPVPAMQIPVTGFGPRTWFTVPDGLFKETPAFVLRFAEDPSATRPRVRLEPGGREIPLAPTPGSNEWTAVVDGLATGAYDLNIVERISSGDAVVFTVPIHMSEPEYVVWTLDFEGDEASDETMANTRAISEAFLVPMTILWNPRVWTTAQVSRERAEAMQKWMVGTHEIGLHLHMWTDYVRAAGVTPRLVPSWAGRSDGYDVPMTAYTEDEQRTLIAYGLKLMADHGLAGVTSFRAGGDFADAGTLRALAASGITADCTAVPAGTFGRLRWPWTLPADAQPYRPSREDANKPGDLPLLEAPTNAGNTYGYTVSSIAPIVRADVAMLAKPGEVATSRKGLTIVSHPGTIDASERAAIESLFRAFDPLRYDRDAGPLRFVTLKQLTQAWR